MQVWVKQRFDEGQAVKVKYSEGIDFDDLKRIIQGAEGHPLGSVVLIHSADSDERVYELKPGAKVPSPDQGIGSSDDNPYFYSLKGITGKKRKWDEEKAAPGATLIKVDDTTPLAPVASCTIKLNLDFDHNFVDLVRVVGECVDIVCAQLPLETTASSYRVPPLVLIRFARGGKTITLASLFIALKQKGSVCPIFVSFNGSGPSSFRRRDGETQKQAILRMIALQLGDYSAEDALNLVVDRDVLERHFGDNNVVLLIDELNSLGAPLDYEAAALLREMFLDKRGRFLVMTSHFPVSIEAEDTSASAYLGTGLQGSMRGVSTVNMSLAGSLDELRNMSPRCDSLTEEHAAWLGYIPSLVFCKMTDQGKLGVVTPSKRFSQMNITLQPGVEEDILMRFVRELLSGKRDPLVAPYFGALASVNADGLVAYPLCYVIEIFRLFDLDYAVVELVKILAKLESHLQAKLSGLAWECTVQVAIILRMLEAQWFQTRGPFDILPERFGTKGKRHLRVDFREIRDEFVKLDAAKKRLDEIIAEYDRPTLIFATSANSCLEQVEGFVAYTRKSKNTVIIKGFQMKSGDIKPRHEMDTNLINGGAVLIRGRTGTATNPRAPKTGWSYMTSAEIRLFLGNSLLLAMPREWLLDP